VVSTFRQLQKDLKRGAVGEEQVQDFLDSTFGIKTKNVGKDNPHWDLEVIDENVDKRTKTSKNLNKYGRTYEVKRDDTSKKTGNFYFEVWSNRQHLNAGCISNCKADTIVIASGDTLYFLERSLFYTWVFENLFFQTDLAKEWKKRCDRIASGRLVSAKNNPDVEGILIPLVHLKDSYCCIGVFKEGKQL